MRRSAWWVAGLFCAAACATKTPEPGSAGRTPPAEPFAAAFVALEQGQTDEARALLAEAARRHPALDDYTLYFRARAAVRAHDRDAARESADRLLALHPDSVWRGATHLLRGELARAAGDLVGARDFLLAARDTTAAGGDRWARASVTLAEVEHELGETAAALDRVREVRRSRPRGLAARRARRLADRIREAHPELIPWGAVEEAEMRLKEDDAAGVARALDAGVEPSLRPRALWVRAQAEHALGHRDAAEAACRALADEERDPLAPRALFSMAGWRWNADDDAGAVALFEEVGRRFPGSPNAVEELYAIGRIRQERAVGSEGAAARRDFEAAAADYARLADRFPRASLAGEARWRVAWLRWLEGDAAAAARAFAALVGRSAYGMRVSAEYWEARALARLGRDAEARELWAHVADRHRVSYYAGLAEERLGRAVATREAVGGEVAPPAPRPFPANVEGAHAARARLLTDLGFPRFARLEVDALRDAGLPRRRLLEAYDAIGAPGAALRLAREMRSPAASNSPGALRRYLYPLGYWAEVQAAAHTRGVDPFLVQALIRQESLFDPDAVSPADARGLMQLLPATAHRLVTEIGWTPPRPGVHPPLHRPDTNVELGTALLARLLDRYGGARDKALAAYNAGEDAVAKWERRYAGREPDEFVELISFRETRDYVKAVLRNYRVYRSLYTAAPPNDSPSSAGSPPNAPFDMTTMTSSDCAEATR